MDETTHSESEGKRVLRCESIISDAVALYRPVKVIGLFSGGHDSLTACHIASRHPAFSYAAHLNTGIGVKETREFVRKTAASRGWNLREYFALKCGQDYADIVAKYGFPGPGQHSTMYRRLKERTLRVAIREAKEGHPRRSTVLLISGVRFQESQRRMGYKEPVTREGSKIWVNIINDWSKLDCGRYMQDNGIPRSPVVDLIHKSGECLCGSFAKPGEFEELEMFFPETAAHIKSLKCGKGRSWGWGANGKQAAAPGPMCSSCILNSSLV